MTPEQKLAEFLTQLSLDDVSSAARHTARRVLLADIGTGVAGAGEDGIAELRALLRQRGGAPEARSLVFGDRLPAHAAAQLNGTMCRALDFCDAMAPGIHIGSSVVPAAFAAAEAMGGCSGRDLLTAIIVGCEIGARFNLTEAMYNGFDPTGVAIVFASTAAASRLFGLTEKQSLDALGLAFNRCGGSFQSNIDGSLAVRVVQGWVAQTGVECAQMALAGITGPRNFLTGIYGYPKLFGRGLLEPGSVAEGLPSGLASGLASDWRMNAMMFKKYPSCGATQGLTELTLEHVAALDLTPDTVESVEVRLNPYCHRLVGHPFELGDNPRVNAQFSVQYCVANAIARRSSRLAHFKVEQIVDPTVRALIDRVSAVSDPALDARGHTAVDVTVTTRDGRRHHRQLDTAPGYPGNPLSEAQHLQRFRDCMAYAAHPLAQDRIDELVFAIDDIGNADDARSLIDRIVII